jgi:hypothetical protein
VPSIAPPLISALVNEDEPVDVTFPVTFPGAGTFSALVTTADHIRINTSQTPASSSASGAAGEIAWDSNYIYVCVATNSWKRVALSTF